MISAVVLFDWGLGGTPVPAPVVPVLSLLASARTTRRVAAGGAVMPRLPARADVAPRLPAGPLTRRLLLAADRRRVRLAAGPTVPLPRKASDRMSISSTLTFFRGEDLTLDFQLTPPADVTGWAITFQLADQLGGTVQVTKTATVTDGPRGRFRVSLASADTATLAPGRHVWDVRRTDNGSRATLADGFLDLRQEVTP